MKKIKKRLKRGGMRKVVNMFVFSILDKISTIMQNLKKHKILKLLWKVRNDNRYTASNITEAGKSLSAEDIHRETKYNLDTVNKAIESLHSDGYIKRFRLYGKGETDFWGIRDKGVKAMSEHTFVWYYKVDKILLIISILIALYGALNSTFHFTGK